MLFSIITGILYMGIILVLNRQLPLYDRIAPADKKGKMQTSTIVFMMAVAFLARVIFASSTIGHASDMICWTGWSKSLVEHSPWGFYTNGKFCDYPPGYMYVLWIIGGIVKLFNIQEPFVWTLYKLPAIIADVMLAYTIYKIAEKEINGKVGIILFLAVAFNPLLYYDSTVWGQMDSVLILFLTLSLYALYEEKYYKSVLLYATAAFIKPQAFMLLPLMLVLFLRKKDFVMFIKAVVIAVGLAVILSIPFSPAWQNDAYTNVFQKFIMSFNPWWLIEKYIATLSSYKYATVNAFNFYALFEANWQPIGNRFIFLTYQVWGNIAIVIGVVVSMLMAFKIKNRGNAAFLSSFFLIAFLFAFATKMHERYLIPAIIFVLMGYIFTKDRRFFLLFAFLSLANLLNIENVLDVFIKNPKGRPEMIWIVPIAISQLLLIITGIVLVYKTCLKKQDDNEIQETGAQKLKRLEARGNFLGIRYNRKENRDILKEPKMVKWDYIIMAAITLIYAVVAFTNLGDTTAPQTFYKPDKAGDSFVVEFNNEEIIATVAYYDGIGKVKDKPHLDVEYSLDGVNWEDFGETATLKSVFRWEISNIEPIRAKYLRATAENADYRIFEMGFRNEKGELIGIKSVTGNGSSNYAGIFDEQQYVPTASTYMNSTYFDEIYHPRTAYEHLHLMPYYETTHPPLGKLIMSVGIAIFGMTPFGWRVTGTLFGVLMLPVFYIFLKKIFGRTRYATIGTFLFAVDFMHYSLTRMGTIDSYPVFFIIAMYYFMYTFARRTLYFISEDKGKFFKKKGNKKSIIIPLIMSGISFGLGVSSKWIGVYAGAGLLIEFILIMIAVYRKLPKENKSEFKEFFFKICAWCMGFFVIIPFLIYTASYIPISMVDGYGNAFEAMWKNQKYMLNYHGTLKSTHPYSSRWWQWIFDKKPLWAYQLGKEFRAEGNVGAISIFGNPILYWAGLGAIFYTVISGIKQKSKTVLFLVVGILAQFLPWTIISRTTYMYHYFATTPFMIIMLVYAIRELEYKYKNFKYITIAFCIVCLIMFIMFYPVITGIEVSQSYVDMFLRWFKSWVFYN